MNDSADPPAGGDRVAARLHRRYLAAFAVTAALLVANQLLIRPPLLRLESDAPAINVAGRQRMLGQRLAKAVLALSSAETDAERIARRRELAETLALWSTSHELLRAGRGSSGENSAEVAAAFEALHPVFLRMRAAAAGIVADPSSVDEELPAVLENEREFLARMDAIVGLYEAEASDRAARLRRTGWLVTGLVLLALAAVGGFVLVPASRVIQRQVTELRQARDRLEDRVRERTAELERANRERNEAEERHRRLLEEFGHAARVNTMGEMAGGLAHELNQPLGAVANYVGGCLERLDAGRTDLDELRAALEKAQEAALRAGEIVRRIRRFVAQHEVAEEEVDPSRLVADVVGFLRDEADRRGVRVEMETAPDLPSVRGDAIQLQQVLVNLIRNAFDAVEAAKPMIPKVLVTVTRSPGGGVCFSVIDNGEGLDREQTQRIFEPFFSTRAGGMGMGLAISRGIVEAHHGRIEIESEPGAGTAMRFTLPAAEA